MLTVSPDSVVVEGQLQAGELVCPACEGSLGPWGWARRRVVRDGPGGDLSVQPRRSRCRRCRATQVLLPVTVLLRRAYSAAVIGAAFELAALGWVSGAIAERLEMSPATVRSWLVRLSMVAAGVRAHFMRWLVWLAPSRSQVAPCATPLGEVVAVIVAAGEAAADQLGVGCRWQFASAATGGRLLCNTSFSFPAPWRR